MKREMRDRRMEGKSEREGESDKEGWKSVPGSWKNCRWLAPDQHEKHYTKIEFYQLWLEPKCENSTQNFSFNSPQFYCFVAPSKVEK